ncbi:unnamed protein product [Boreogadus saida]
MALLLPRVPATATTPKPAPSPPAWNPTLLVLKGRDSDQDTQAVPPNAPCRHQRDYRRGREEQCSYPSQLVPLDAPHPGSDWKGEIPQKGPGLG